MGFTREPTTCSTHCHDRRLALQLPGGPRGVAMFRCVAFVVGVLYSAHPLAATEEDRRSSAAEHNADARITACTRVSHTTGFAVSRQGPARGPEDISAARHQLPRSTGGAETRRRRCHL